MYYYIVFILVFREMQRLGFLRVDEKIEFKGSVNDFKNIYKLVKIYYYSILCIGKY